MILLWVLLAALILFSCFVIYAILLQRKNTQKRLAMFEKYQKELDETEEISVEGMTDGFFCILKSDGACINSIATNARRREN